MCFPTGKGVFANVSAAIHASAAQLTVDLQRLLITARCLGERRYHATFRKNANDMLVRNNGSRGQSSELWRQLFFLLLN
jgi:hypothetical protein